jgi:small subunit ribosomal protein S2
MKQVTLEELLEAGCHFGHQVTRQNPKSREFVFEARDNIHIIDLEKTKECLDEALGFIVKLASQPESSMILLGAKRQAQNIVKDEVKRAKEAGANGLYSVTQRWIGGTLTNYPEVAKNFKRLKDLEKNLSSDSEKSKYTKKEISLWEKERAKLESFYGGIADMPAVPSAVFIIDTHLEDLAVREAHATGVKTIGITDTNSDPTLIDYPIPANDDAVGSIQLITQSVVNAWIEGRKKGKEQIAKGEGQNGEAKKEEKTEKSVVKKEKAVELSEEKKKETKKTPEKISVE